MKKRRWILLLAVITVLALTACTQSDTKEGEGQAAPGSSGTQASGQGSVSGSVVSEENGSGEGIQGGSVSDPSASTPSTPAEPVQPGQEASGVDDGYEENVSYEDVDEEESASEEEETYSDDELDGLPEGSLASSGADWAGTYISDEGETLTLAAADADNITFAFANSGISGTAKLDGTQAVYHGDDQHVVVFEYVEGAINVSALSEEDYDTSESPLNGLYVSQ